MSIYYEDEWVTLYHGDCREVTAWLEADVLVTDPPYGMDYTGFGGRKGNPRRAEGRLSIQGDRDTGLRDEVLTMWGDRPALVFGRWNVARPAGVRQVLIWDKGDDPGMGALDIPWGPSFEDCYVLGRGFVGKRGGSVLRVPTMKAGNKDRPDHPTPKPTGLLERLVLNTVGAVADPFVGAGSTLLAAKALGRRAIGVELEERYCEIAAKRLAQDTLFGGVA